jgi:hypothetical protein
VSASNAYPRTPSLMPLIVKLWHDMADAAVLAVSAADLAGGSNDGGPHGSCGAPGDGLPLKGGLAFRCELLIHQRASLRRRTPVQG